MSSHVMGSQHCIGGEVGFLNILFKIPIIFCHWLSEYYKKKERWSFMLAVSNKSNLLKWVGSCHARLHHENNNRKRCQNDVQNAAIMVLSYYNLAPVRKGLLQAHRDRCWSLVKLLCIYFCCLNLLNRG